MPGSLGQAIDYAKKSELLRGTFGEELFEKYINAKKKEWNQYRIVVSRWELEKYFEVL
jgi:glutamine synthetase